ncbi:aldehyde dehydrogenase family protein [Subtercola endophyticus]|uniref:aldehyde dehydrogenase family protein n=1 Tax=Subtercola endophyticus TaxID=2895559 RepID=UPI001E622C1A|nr:aldehyde dehydrogenase family protein [Subtercola endophyticus]UFS58114.1 aldehyde dehydrogenase family protein [Subtercola endophyticus]
MSQVVQGTVEQTLTNHVIDVDIPEPDAVFVGGEWVKLAEAATIDVIDPTTEQVLLKVARPGVAEADAAVAAARAAFDKGEWPRMSPGERVAAVRRFTDAITEKLEDLNRAWAFESGPTLAHARIINNGAAVISWNSSIDIAESLPWEEDRGDAIIRREPTGTVLAILTNNGPTVLIGMKVVPALLAGCTVVVKHAPESQLSAHILAEAARTSGLPKGVINFVPAELDITQYLVSHDGIDMVTITGSQRAATDIVQRTAGRLARTALELGGKSPAILGEDFDLESVIPNLAEGAQAFNGQVCVALSRILVPNSRYDETAAAFADYFSKFTLGDPFSPDTTRGPLATARSVTRVEGFVKGALAQGADIVIGGKQPDGFEHGYFYEPTVLGNVTRDMTVAQEEVFGPVTVLMRYDGIDEAVEIANDTDYGLAGSIFTQDNDFALQIARRIRSGTVGVNVSGMSLGQPFGGMKKSGWGRECGPEGILEFTDIKQMLLPSGTSYLQA